MRNIGKRSLLFICLICLAVPAWAQDVYQAPTWTPKSYETTSPPPSLTVEWEKEMNYKVDDANANERNVASEIEPSRDPSSIIPSPVSGEAPAVDDVTLPTWPYEGN